MFDTGLYEGIKFHELETPWNGRRKRDLERILAIAAESGLAVQMHSGGKNCMPLELAKWAEKYPTVRFDFAHCCPIDDMAKVVAEHPNVWTDCGLWQNNDWKRLGDYDWYGRLMFGSDFPAYHARFAGGFAELYREFRPRYDAAVANRGKIESNFLARRRCPTVTLSRNCLPMAFFSFSWI